jgi:hypothetical protein
MRAFTSLSDQTVPRFMLGFTTVIGVVYFKAVQLFIRNAQAPKPPSNRFETTSWRWFTQAGYVIDLARLHGSDLV